MGFTLYIGIMVNDNSMKAYNFIFVCLYSLVPKKAMFGQKNVAIILLSVITSLLTIMFYSFMQAYFLRDFQKSIYSGIGFFLIIAVNFYLNSRIFDNRERTKKALTENAPIKSYHKIIGVALLVITCLLFVESASYISKYNTMRG